MTTRHARAFLYTGAIWGKPEMAPVFCFQKFRQVVKKILFLLKKVLPLRPLFAKRGQGFRPMK
jgi:hypothetical protein